MCSHRTRSVGSKEAKNHLLPGLGQGTDLNHATVVLFRLKIEANVFYLNAL